MAQRDGIISRQTKGSTEGLSGYALSGDGLSSPVRGVHEDL